MAQNNLPTRRPEHRGGSPFDMLQQRIDRMFEDFSLGLAVPRNFGGSGELMPSLEMHEQEGKVLVNAELPGVEEKDISISADENLLTISGEKHSELEDNEGGTYRSERAFGRFSRSVHLPFVIDPDKVEARFVNGVLSLTIEKPANAGPQIRKIPIQH